MQGGGSIMSIVLLCNLAVVAMLADTLHHRDSQHWFLATASWHGELNGPLRYGGACGFGSMADENPYRAPAGAASPILFMNGQGCGACYQIKCLDSQLCSRRAVTVIITDVASGHRPHFVLSGAGFSEMAVTGKSLHLLERVVVPVLYSRTPCKYGGKIPPFRLNVGSTKFQLSPPVEGRRRDIREVSNLAAQDPYVLGDPQYPAPQTPQVQFSQPPQSQQDPPYQQQWPQPPPVRVAEPQLLQSQSQTTTPPSAVHSAYVQNEPLNPPPPEQVSSSIPMQMLAPGAPPESRSQADVVAVPYGYGGLGKPPQTQPLPQP